jgi:NADH dehydrogenase
MRVAKVVGRKPLAIPLPIWFHRLFAIGAELGMRQPIVSRAQVRTGAEVLPGDLLPSTAFSEEAIRAGLPDAGRYRCSDLRCAIS